MPAQPQKAVIYCRVSSQKQVTEGNGLASQETRCREYAKYKNYDVVEVFRDEGLSGKLMNRPNMKSMLSYLKKHKQDDLIVIIDDISRLARDIETHIYLRKSIADAGGKLESPSVEFGDDSDSRLVEHMLATVAAHHRDKNAEQVKNRMKARMQSGYAVFNAPIGYIYQSCKGHGKILVRDEPIASIIAEALEGFACGRFETQSEIKRFLESSPSFPKDKNGAVHYQRVKDLLHNVIYAGFLDRQEWGISLVKGHHEPLISYETHQKIQKRVNTQAKAPTRADINQDFPLRGFVTCACCNHPMTACWTKGRNALYPYYLCKTKGCELSNKSIKREEVEGAFEKLLKTLKPSKPMFYVAAEMFTDLWENKKAKAKQEAESIRREVIRIERKSENLLERILETDSTTLITAYENKVKKLEKEKIRLDENIAKCGRPMQSFKDTFQTALSFLSNPHNLWASGRLEDKRTVIKLAFDSTLQYCQKTGFQTAAIALPFRVFERFCNNESRMVHPRRFERLTHSLEGIKTVSK